MKPNRLARAAPLEEGGAGDAGGLEVIAEQLRKVAALPDRIAVLVDEHERLAVDRCASLGPERAPGAEGANDARVEGPRSRVVGLVLVQSEDASLEINVCPGEPTAL